jgi:hypothetical protein
MARVPKHRYLRRAAPCLFECTTLCTEYDGVERVPTRAKVNSFEADPFVKSKPAIPSTRLRDLDAGNGSSKVAAEGLRRPSVIAALLFAPITPYPEKLGSLDSAAGGDDAAVAHERPDRGAQVLEFPNGIFRRYRRDEVAAFE